jgi:DNA polymerase bacteriophage-type
MRSATVRAMPTLFWDIETRSVVSLETAGEWRYAADPTTDVLCVGYAVDDNNPLIWTPGDPIPEAFTTAAADSSWRVVAHNYAFERAISTRVLEPRYGWPRIPITQQRCSMTWSWSMHCRADWTRPSRRSVSRCRRTPKVTS